MVDLVNARLPSEKQFSYEWWYWMKYQRLYSEYKRLYPGAPLLERVRMLKYAMFAFVAIALWGLLPSLRALN